MGIAEAVAALESAALMSRSKAVQDLVGLVLSKLGGPVDDDRDANPQNSAPLTNAEKCRRYRSKRDTATVSPDTVATPSDTVESVGATPSPLVLSSLSSSSDSPSPSPSLFLNASLSLEDTGSSESTGAREGEPTPSLPESRTQRVAKRVASVRGTRVPASSASHVEAIEWARNWGVDVDSPEWPKFLDHWRAQPGQRGVKLDWGATWRNWVRRAPGFAGAPGYSGPAPIAPPRMRPEQRRARDNWEREARAAGPLNMAELVAKAQGALGRK